MGLPERVRASRQNAKTSFLSFSHVVLWSGIRKPVIDLEWLSYSKWPTQGSLSQTCLPVWLLVDNKFSQVANQDLPLHYNEHRMQMSVCVSLFIFLQSHEDTIMGTQP